MKNIVINESLETKDFKPNLMQERYAALTELAMKGLVNAGNLSVRSICPACQSASTQEAFMKFGIQYRCCSSCASLFAGTHPNDAAIVDFYLNSPARQFWHEAIYQPTADNRREKIIKPRLTWMEDSTMEYFPQAKSWADINTNQSGFDNSTGGRSVFVRKALINPLIKMQLPSDFQIINKPWWDAQGQWDVISLFEVIDHTADVGGLLGKVNQLLPKGGLCFLTGILGSGFDVQELWDRADYLIPPDRLNILSLEGYESLFKAHGFEILEFSTPGVLDIEMVAQAQARDKNIPLSRFARYLLSRPVEDRRAFGEFLQSNRLSSYGRMLIRKG